MKYEQLVDKTIDFVGGFFESVPFYIVETDTTNDTALFLADDVLHFVTFNDDGSATFGRA